MANVVGDLEGGEEKLQAQALLVLLNALATGDDCTLEVSAACKVHHLCSLRTTYQGCVTGLLNIYVGERGISQPWCRTIRHPMVQGLV